jgi:hypothetical protein
LLSAAVLALFGAIVGISLMAFHDGVSGAPHGESRARDTSQNRAAGKRAAESDARQAAGGDLLRADPAPTIDSKPTRDVVPADDVNAIVGIVVDEHGVPLAKFLVRSTDTSRHDVAEGFTTQEGKFRIENQRANDYLVQVSEANAIYADRPVASAHAARPFKPLRFVVCDEDRPICAIRGRVIDADGAPIAGATVQVDYAPQLSFAERAGNDGRFLMAGMQAGERTVRVAHPKYVEARLPTFRLEGVRDVGDVTLTRGTALAIHLDYPSDTENGSATVALWARAADGGSTWVEGGRVKGNDWESKALARGEVVAIATDFVSRLASEPTVVPIRAGESPKIRLAMIPARRVTLGLRANAKNPLDGRPCSLRVFDAAGFIRASFGENGVPWRPGRSLAIIVPDGHYRLQVLVDSKPHLERDLAIDPDRDVSNPIVVEF